MRILCFGISYKTAPIKIREQLAFDQAATQRALTLLHKQYPAAEFMLLSTCNRTELYIIRPLHGHPREDELLGWLRKFHDAGIEDFNKALYIHRDADAVSHLFAVAAGLDSQVPGEDQIVSQLKHAYSAAQKANTANGPTATLVAAALRTAKQVRSETPISRGKVSIASIALECISQMFGSLKNKRLLSVGGGKISEILLRQIRSLKPMELLVSNRSRTRADKLGTNCDARVIPFGEIGKMLGETDVVVTCTSSREPIITTEMIRNLPSRNTKTPLLLIDLGLPRDIETAAGDIKNVHLHNLDDLQSIIDQTFEVRKDHLDIARQIVANRVREFMDGMKIRDIIPTIDGLYKRIDAIVEGELSAGGNRGISETESENLRQSLRRSLRRFCHPVVENLRKNASAPISEAHANVIRKIFSLDDN